MIQVRALQSSDEFQRYADLAAEVYREDPHWVPPDREDFVAEIAGRVPQCTYSRIQAFWAESGGRPVAAVTAVVDREYNQRWGEQSGHLFMFEALPGREEEVQALLQTVGEWLRGQGCNAARFGFLFGWELPMTIDAYDQVPTIFHRHNPPYYHSYVKNAGFGTERGAMQYQVRFTGELATSYRRMVNRGTALGVRLRQWDFSRLEQETALFTGLLNDTFGEHWGCPPLPASVAGGLTLGLKDLLVADFTQFAEVDGETVGFVYALPDLNQMLHPGTRREFRDIDHGVLLIIGVKKSHRGRGINLALAGRSYLAMIERGYKTASYTVVLDDNWPSRRTAEKLGARVTRNFVIYRKGLAPNDHS